MNNIQLPPPIHIQNLDGQNTSIEKIKTEEVQAEEIQIEETEAKELEQERPDFPPELQPSKLRQSEQQPAEPQPSQPSEPQPSEPQEASGVTTDMETTEDDVAAEDETVCGAEAELAEPAEPSESFESFESKASETDEKNIKDSMDTIRQESENEDAPLESDIKSEYKPPAIPREEGQQETTQEAQEAIAQKRTGTQALRQGTFLSAGTDIAVMDYAGFGRWNGYDPMRFTFGAGFFIKAPIAKKLTLGFDAYAIYAPHLYSANTPNIYGKAADGTHWKDATWEAVNHIIGTGARVSVDMHPSEHFVLSLLAGVETAAPAEKSEERTTGRIFFGSYALVVGAACEIGLGNSFALGFEGLYVHVPDYRGSAGVRISLRSLAGTAARSATGAAK